MKVKSESGINESKNLADFDLQKIVRIPHRERTFRRVKT